MRSRVRPIRKIGLAWGCHMLLASVRKVLGLTQRHSNAVCLCKGHKGYGVFPTILSKITASSLVRFSMLGNVGNTLVCKDCGHERLISQVWLDGLMRRYYPTSASRLGALNRSLLSRLKCSVCKSKTLALVEPSSSSSSSSSSKTYTLCSACGGDGSYEGRCYKCFGTGLIEDST